jgi:hypothetical protein
MLMLPLLVALLGGGCGGAGDSNDKSAKNEATAKAAPPPLERTTREGMVSLTLRATPGEAAYTDRIEITVEAVTPAGYTVETRRLREAVQRG